MGTWRNRNLAQLRAKEQVGGSNPLVPFIFSGFVAQPESERKNSTLEAAGSNPAEVISVYSGFVQSAGRLTLDQEIVGSNPLPGANFFYFWVFRRWLYGLVLETSVRRFESCHPDQFFLSGRSTDGYMGMPWEHVFVSSNLTALIKIFLPPTWSKRQRHWS
jgi:hypothetical protein